MHLSESHSRDRLPKRFPVGTTYVVESRGRKHGDLRVFSRYVVLPGGRRINLAQDSGGPALPRTPASRTHGRARSRSENQPQSTAKDRAGGVKKIMTGDGTARQHHR